MRKKIALIGYGASAIGFLRCMLQSDHHVTVFEKRAVVSEKVGGLGYDGKLFITEDLADRFLYRPGVPLQEEIAEYLISFLKPGSTLRKGTSFGDSYDYSIFSNYGLKPIAAKIYHIGTDQLDQVVNTHCREVSKIPNVTFRFGTVVNDLISHGNHFIVRSSGPGTSSREDIFNTVIIAVGRTGFRLIQKLVRKWPELRMHMPFADIGIRYEMSNRRVQQINDKMYEFKISFNSTNGIKLRTFCNNPSGFVVTESFDGFTTVNGHSLSNVKSDNTNLAFLASYKIPDLNIHPNDYCESIAVKSNNEAGRKEKVILQTYGDFRRYLKTYQLAGVVPTLAADRFTKGNLWEVLPKDLCESIIEFIEALAFAIDGFNSDENLVYGVEAKLYGELLNNKIYPNLKFIGDCSGYTGNIVTAASMGYKVAEELLL